VQTIVINLRVPDTEVTRLRHLGEEEAEEDVERQLIRDERSHAQRTYERGELQRESGGTETRFGCLIWSRSFFSSDR
jgi:hypothetical protein